jgi:two-component system, OmpR family, sensor histidine kinase MtrB
MSEPEPEPGRPPRRVRGLRLRVTASFALGSLVLVGILSVVTYLFAEHYLVLQRERSLLHQASVDARAFRGDLQRRGDVKAALDAMERTPGSDVSVFITGRWYGTSAGAGATQLPAQVRTDVAGGAQAQMRLREDGRPVFVVGLPLRSVDGQYYETFVLAELDRTLRVIRTALVAGGVLAIVLGGLLGFWMSRRVLRPVTEFAVAAQQVAAGDLGTRLARDGDPDLDSLAISFNEMVDSVERRIDRETQFVADVSHELRSPLTTLATTVEVLSARRLDLPERVRPAFDLLEIEVQRLGELVEDLLELGRAEAGVEELDLGAVELGEFMRRAIDPIHADGTKLTMDDELGGQRVLVDKRRLERVLANLVSNAEMHGEGLKRVAVSRRDGSLRIEVDDYGMGVGVPERDAVFSRFFRGAAAGRRSNNSGSGLGLALVAEHVSLHGGRVSIEDVEPTGTRFVVEIPWRDP